MKKKSYVGVTGFMTHQEVVNTLKDIDFQKTEKLLMIGVLASLKSIQGITNKWPQRYPLIGEIRKIFPTNQNCLNLIHFNTSEPENLLSQMLYLTDIAGEQLNGFQLNLTWPSAKTVERYKRIHNGKSIVLQIGSRAFEEVSHSPQKLADRVHNEYEGLIDYVLLDPSGGTGAPFNPRITRGYLEALSTQKNDFGLGIAGGLSPSTLDLIEPFIKDFPELSIDAEGKLRTPEDNLSVSITRDYIQKSLELFSEPLYFRV